MPPRRSHKKSRAGCKRCKSRKIKCDEIHPRCGNCLKHGVACDFEYPEIADDLPATPSVTIPATPATIAGTPSAISATPDTPFDFKSPLLPVASASSPAIPIAAPMYRAPSHAMISPATSVTSRLLELRLLHHYTTMTSKTLSFTGPGTEAIWRDIVPTVAFAGFHHLTDAVLAVSALHLRSITPNDKDLVRASHAYMASSLREYSETLTRGINASNAEALFLTSTLIAFQSTATRVFNKDELSLNNGVVPDSLIRSRAPPGGYSLPLPWFHAFQGVKAVTAASWSWLRESGIVLPIIDSQPVLQLDFSATSEETFFGHLLRGLDEEIAALPNDPVPPQPPVRPSLGSLSSAAAALGNQPPPPVMTVAGSTKQAYEHAVAVLNWAHKIPQKGAPLAFPATVSRRFVELLEERKPRALAILACYFALLKSLDSVWWLQGMARREVLGVVSLFNSDYFGSEVERRWWPHLEWAVRVALYDDSANPGSVPPEVWGATWLDEDTILADRGSQSYKSHIELLSQMVRKVSQHPPRTDDPGTGIPRII